MLLKVEGEKNYHLRIAAILSDVEVEVCSWLHGFQRKFFFSFFFFFFQSYLLFCLDLEHVADGLRETAERVCSPYAYVGELLRENNILLG